MITIKLGDGRKLVLDLVTPHEAMGIAEGCRQLSGIRQWWKIAMAVSSIRSIDEIPLPLPTGEKHIEGMVGRFSAQDLKAIIEALEAEPVDEDSPDLEFAELTPLETLKVWAVIGDFETIGGWVAPAFMACCVRKIGDEKICLPTTKKEIKALVERLGPAGMSKASLFRLARSAAEKNAEVDKLAAAKN